MPPDPTADLLASLSDPTRFQKVERVAVFRAHRREFPDGVVEVTDDDLAEIAKNVNAAYRSDGVLVPLTAGHRKTGRDVDERSQPKVFGFARNYRAELVERPGGKVLRLVQDEYFYRHHAGEAAGFPGRSVEYDPAAKTITGCALLVRDPHLLLGTVSYARDRRLYQMEPVMPADDDDKPKVSVAIDADDDDKFSPEEEKQYARVAKYMRKKYAKLAAYMDDDLPATIPAGTEKIVDPTADPMKAYHKDPVVAGLQKQIAEQNRRAVEQAAARLLDPLTAAVKFDYAREMKAMCLYASDADRGKHAEYMLANYEKLPYGSMVRTADSPALDYAAAPHAAPVNYEKIKAKYRANPGMTYEEAEALVAAGK